jgi:putative transcriptional regulator
MALEWRLRQVMASRNIWSGAELGRRMEQQAGYRLSAPSLSALLQTPPRALKAQTMDALCTALDCTPADLWHHTPPAERPAGAEPPPPTRAQRQRSQGQRRAANDAPGRVLPPL